jgi:hypothetical protein
MYDSWGMPQDLPVRPTTTRLASSRSLRGAAPHGEASAAHHTVRRIAMPPGARALGTLPRIDYEDAFLVETGPARDRTAEQWARAMLEHAPIMLRNALPWAWFALGLRLGPARSDRFVLGWELRRSTPDDALLTAGSRLGAAAELLFKRQQHTLLFATFVQQETGIARAAWVGVAPLHRRVVRHLLEQAGRSQRRGHRP